MKRTDGPGTAPGGLFTAGTPGVTPPTTVIASWCNNVQEELCNFIEGQGITLDGSDMTQLSQALATLVSGINAVIICGQVDASGNLVSGSGYTCNKQATGTYEVIFNSSFAAVPGVMATAKTNSLVPTGLITTAHTIITFIHAVTSTPTNTAFSFIAALSI